MEELLARIPRWINISHTALEIAFGMDFDPLTGKLWDTENGPTFGDEINLVDPGFNSGWWKVQGMWTVERGQMEGGWLSEKPSNLVDFGNKGVYSSPELSWNSTVGPTALKFLTTDKLGKEYRKRFARIGRKWKSVSL